MHTTKYAPNTIQQLRSSLKPRHLTAPHNSLSIPPNRDHNKQTQQKYYYSIVFKVSLLFQNPKCCSISLKPHLSVLPPLRRYTTYPTPTTVKMIRIHPIDPTFAFRTPPTTLRINLASEACQLLVPKCLNRGVSTFPFNIFSTPSKTKTVLFPHHRLVNNCI